MGTIQYTVGPGSLEESDRNPEIKPSVESHPSKNEGWGTQQSEEGNK
jgi:hypothetical protein